MEAVMHEALRKEIETYEKRTPRSREAHKKAVERLPLGVASNYRAYDPYPIFVRDGKGGRIHDIDGNEYVDFNLCFGALMAGHCHPAVVSAVQKKLSTGTMFGMPHDMEWDLAEEICKRFPVEMVRFCMRCGWRELRRAETASSRWRAATMGCMIRCWFP
jgi:glutamate-1-semialdehyde 2,1-aminomutase